MHVLNNWLAFGVALAFGDMGSALNPTGGTWWSIPVTLTQSLTYLRAGVVGRPPDGARDPDRPSRFGRPRGARVRFLPGPPGPRSGRERPATIGIWCNWQHDWFWSS